MSPSSQPGIPCWSVYGVCAEPSLPAHTSLLSICRTSHLHWTSHPSRTCSLHQGTCHPPIDWTSHHPTEQALTLMLPSSLPLARSMLPSSLRSACSHTEGGEPPAFITPLVACPPGVLYPDTGLLLQLRPPFLTPEGFPGVLLTPAHRGASAHAAACTEPASPLDAPSGAPPGFTSGFATYTLSLASPWLLSPMLLPWVVLRKQVPYIRDSNKAPMEDPQVQGPP